MTEATRTEADADRRLAPAQAAWMKALAELARRPLTYAMTLPLLSGLLLLVQAWSLARALQWLVIDDRPLAAAWPWLALAAAMVLLRAVLAGGAELAGQRAAESVKQTLRDALFARLLSASVLWSRGRPSGALADALSARVEMLDGYFARYLPAMVSAAVLPLVFCVVLLGFDWIAALVLVLTVPAIPLFMALVGWGAEAAGRSHASALLRLSGLFADRVRGLTTLKLFGRADDEAARVAQASDEVRVRTLSVLKIAFLSSAVLEFFAALGVAGLAVYFGLTFLGMLDVRADVLTLEAALFCLLMAPEVYLPMRQLAAHYHDRANARAAVAEIDGLFDGLPEMAGAVVPGVAPAASVSLSSPLPLRIDNLHMPVPGRAGVRVEGAAMLSPGARLAVIGPSGSGKSTLLETLAGLRPHDGGLWLDTQPLRDWQDPLLRSQLLLIPQRPWLMPGTLADNLQLVRADANEAEMMDALRAASLDSLVASLPLGLQTPVGARGHGLSGGQAQRLALARMFLSDAPVLLLDEPTAHLDNTTRDKVIAAITEFAQGRTLIIATHDPAVAAMADTQWRLDATGQVST